MSLWSEIANRLRHFSRRSQFEWEMEQEIQFHIETRADELEWEGVPREEAVLRARREFGSVRRAEEDSRSAWRFNASEDFAADLRYGARILRRSPGFTLAAVLSLALGIGANTTVFSLVKAALLGNLPVRDPERLVSLRHASGAARISYPDFTDYKAGMTAFEDAAATYPAVPGSLSAGEEPERLWGQIVTTNYFSVVGAEPRLGRGFVQEENSATVVVISDALWRKKFGADPMIVGRTVRLRGESYVVVGIAPPEFHGNLRGLQADFWLPLGLASRTVPQLGQGGSGRLEEDRAYPWLFVTARLKSGMTTQQAESALRVIAQRLDHDFPQRSGARRLRLMAADTLAAGLDQVRMLLGMLMAVVGLVLLVACANVANLLLARSAARQAEMGLRLAIGAGRARLVRQLLAESLLLSVMGAAAGIVLAWAGTRALSRLQTSLPVPAALDLTIDARVLLLTAALTVITGVLFGLVPALKSTRVELTSMLKPGSSFLTPLRHFGLKSGLIVAQVSVSLVLLIAAGLFLRSLLRASSAPLGMDPRNVLVVGLDPRAAGYSNERAAVLFRQLTERIRRLPQVQSASLVDTLPLSFVPNSVGVSRPGRDDVFPADIYGVTTQHFQSLGMPLLRGLDFSDNTQTAIPPIVINEAVAARLFGRENPVGAIVNWEGMPHEVIAVVRNAKSRSVTESPRPQIYVSLDREYRYFWGMGGVTMCIRTQGAPAPLLGPVREQIRDLDANLAIYNTGTMAEHIDHSLLVPRLCGWLSGIFGGIALMLAAVGLYGVMSYSVRRRNKEIGIRIAIGARPSNIIMMFVRQGAGLALVGIAIGMVAALAVSRVLSGFLYGIGPRDLVTFAGVPLVLMAVALTAVLIPAGRASSLEAVRSMKYE